MNIEVIKSALANISQANFYISSVPDHRIVLDQAQHLIEESLGVIIEELNKIKLKEEYFNVLKQVCSQYNTCESCPMKNINQEIFKKCAYNKFFDRIEGWSYIELKSAYESFKKYWEELFNA